MRSLNRVQLIGNLGADPEIRSTQGGQRVASFSLATSRQWKGANGDKQEKTEWHRCIAWNNAKGAQLADIMEKYAGKGDRVYVEGALQYRQWQDREGQTRYTTEIVVREVILLTPAADGAPRAKPAPAAKAPAAKPADAEFEDFHGSPEEEDDDLPF